MKETMKSRIFKRSAWTLLTIFFALLMSIFLIIDPIAQQYYTFVDQFFGVTRTVPVTVETENTQPEDQPRNDACPQRGDRTASLRRGHGASLE